MDLRIGSSSQGSLLRKRTCWGGSAGLRLELGARKAKL